MSFRDRVIELRRVRAGDLLGHDRNWRTHPEAQRAALSSVLEDIGFAGAIVAREDGAGNVVVIDGHLRADMDPEAVVPVLITDLDETEAAELLITYDPIGDMAGTDPEKLLGLLDSVGQRDGALGELLDSLRNDREVVSFLANRDGQTEPDNTPEPPAEPRTHAGDLWVLDDHRVLCGDSTDADAVARLFANVSADMVFTDPPWNVGYVGGTKPQEPLANDDLEVGWEAWLTDALQLVPTIENAPAYVMFGLMRAGDTQQGITAAGWRIVQTLVWVKQLAHRAEQFGNLRAHYKYQHEPIYYCSTGPKVPAFFGPTNERSVWEHDRASANEYHPTQKPVDLIVRAVANSSRAGAVVADPFLGAGSTVIACEKLQRVCYAMELDPRYVDVTVARWEEFTGRKAERRS